MKKHIFLIQVLNLVLFCSVSVVLTAQQEEPGPVTLAEFNKRTGDKNKTVLVYFHAGWCVVCAKMQPVIQKIDSLYRPRLGILNIDTDCDKEVAEQFEIDALPVLMLYEHGTRQWTHVGIMSEKELTNMLSFYIQSNSNK